MFEGRPWNSNTVDLIRLARSHCLLVLHSTFADSVAQLAAEVTYQLHHGVLKQRCCDNHPLGICSTISYAAMHWLKVICTAVLDRQLHVRDTSIPVFDVGVFDINK